MTDDKPKSPFYPGQPVPVDLFVGRHSEIRRIERRGIQQVALGKQTAVYVQGEYGIGKSSIAGFLHWVAETKHGLHGIYASLGGCHGLNDVAAVILEATVKSGVFDPRRSEVVKDWLSKYIGKQGLFGLSINLEALKRDAPSLATVFGMLGFLAEARERLSEDGVKGIVLVLDEIDGVAGDGQFAHFIKGLVDTNALARSPLPLLLVVCGTDDKRRELIQKHPPVDRIFDIVDIAGLSDTETRAFFSKAFGSVQVKVEDEAMSLLVHYSAGFPKIMHAIGEAAFWSDTDSVIDENDALDAVLEAADDIGRKFVDQQVLKALYSRDYRAILRAIALMGHEHMTFRRRDVAAELTATQRGKLDNFLQRMKDLNVIRAGDNRGEYLFNMRMVRLYIWLKYIREEQKTAQRDEPRREDG